MCVSEQGFSFHFHFSVTTHAQRSSFLFQTQASVDWNNSQRKMEFRGRVAQVGVCVPTTVFSFWLRWNLHRRATHVCVGCSGDILVLVMQF